MSIRIEVDIHLWNAAGNRHYTQVDITEAEIREFAAAKALEDNTAVSASSNEIRVTTTL